MEAVGQAGGVFARAFVDQRLALLSRPHYDEAMGWPSRTPPEVALRWSSIVLGCALAWPATASGYVQATVDSGAHTRWYATTVPYTIDEDALQPEGIGKTDMQIATVAAFDAWQNVMCSVCHDPTNPACPPVPCKSHPLGLKMRFDGFAAKAPMGPGCEGGLQPDDACAGITKPAPDCKLVPNGNQVIVVRDPDKWCFGSGTVAMTLVSANQVSGEIADADILLNAAHRSFCTGKCGLKAYDLQNTLTHEAGHMLGLDHSALPEATMFGGAPPQELIKRDLTADDEAGICATYRKVYKLDGCPDPEPPGCCTAATGSGQSGSITWLIVGVGVLCWWRRRTTSARPPERQTTP